MLSDIEIARSVKLQNIEKIANKLGFTEAEFEPYGRNKAKINVKEVNPTGKLILVTAMNPTPYGEGKTTVSIGLADALSSLNKKAVLALREPSLGPVFGIKGGACGGGFSQVAPMEEINLHFTGDFHAITAANDLLSALIDNHIYQGNALKIKKVIFNRCLDVNDRELRSINIGVGGGTNGAPREDGFVITAASEIMAILCLSSSLSDLKKRIGRIVVGYGENGKEIYCRDLHAENAMTVLLKEAIKPNLVQTLEGTPAFIHGGPFANIAHGANSIIATKLAMTCADYTVTEAGFGAELGGEKFLDIVCREANIAPSAVVLVVTVRSIKYNAVDKDNELISGFLNVKRHIENLRKFGQNVIVAINKFPSDTEEEIETVKRLAFAAGAKAEAVTNFTDGGKGAQGLAKVVLSVIEDKPQKGVEFSYELTDSLREKIEKVAKKIYRAGEIKYSAQAEETLARIENSETYSNLPICIAKTQYSFSSDKDALGAPENFVFEVREITPRLGAGFIVAVAGKMMLMPGLPVSPNTDRIFIDDEGNVEGLS